jgi:hypothetical protein
MLRLLCVTVIAFPQQALFSRDKPIKRDGISTKEWDFVLHPTFFANRRNVTEVKDTMRYMVHIEISPEAGNTLDFEEGGPGAILRYLVERFKPEMFYVTTIRRALWMVMDLNETAMAELMLIVSKKFGSYPLCTPVIHGPDVVEMAAEAIEVAKSTP